ncbi:hypothetical protein NOR53_1240 [gamma proteobacterium NOR5-3]|nr:hypothetical protein NOR53_1240 [gamma proteobacterium NOR5-3]
MPAAESSLALSGGNTLANKAFRQHNDGHCFDGKFPNSDTKQDVTVCVANYSIFV